MVKLHIKLKLPHWEKVQEATVLWGSQEGWRTIAAHVRHSRVSKMYRSSTERFESSVPLAHTLRSLSPELLANPPPTAEQLTPSWVWLMIFEHGVKQAKSRRPLEGLAPSGDLERKVQEFEMEKQASEHS